MLPNVGEEGGKTAITNSLSGIPVTGPMGNLDFS